jgi:ribosomal-protein-alanine N-acetyltransferase
MFPLNSSKPFSLHISENQSGGIVVEIETQRLYIRSYQPEDFDYSLKLYGDPALTKMFDHGKPKSRDEVVELVDDLGSRFFRKGEPFGLFSIFDKSNGQFAGHIDLIPSEPSDILEIGIILTPQYQGREYSQEAAKALMIPFVKELKQKGHKISGIMATAHPNNIASIKNIEKMGMVFQRSFQRFGNPRNQYCLFFDPQNSTRSKL